MPVILWIILFGFLMSFISLAGGLLLFLKPAFVDAIILPLIAFAAGSLIGGAVFHMIPHAVEGMGNVTALYVWLAAGFTLFLGLEQFLNWHHSHTHSHSCGPFSPSHQHMPCPLSQPGESRLQRKASETHLGGLDCGVLEGRINNQEQRASNNDAVADTNKCLEENRDGDVEEARQEATVVNTNDSAGTPDASMPPRGQHNNKHRLGTLLLIADTVHNFLGGLFVGASFVDSVTLGLSAWTAAAFHEFPQELGDFAILVHGGRSKTNALLWNFLSSLTFPLGGVVAYVSSTTSNITFLIPFAAGNFLYIGATDLIPEVKHYHGSKTNVLHFASFLLGIGILLSIRIIVDGW